MSDERKQGSNGESLDTTTLPSLPIGWCWTTLETIAKIDGGITKDQKRERNSTTREVAYLRVANVQRGFLDLGEIKTILADEGEIESLRLMKGDILFTEGGDRDKLGRGWVWNDEIPECIHQNHIFRARPRSTGISSKFISYHGNFFGQAWFTRTGKQTTNLASINKGILRRFPVPVAPANEQCRIVEKIEELFSDLDAGVAALERAKANLKQYRAAVLKAAVDGSLTAEWRSKRPDVEPASKLLERILTERRRKWEADQLARFAAAGKQPSKNWQDKYVESQAPDTTNLPALPQSWCWATVDQLTAQEPYALAIGPFGSNLKVSDYTDSGVPLIFVRNIRAASFGQGVGKFVSVAKANELAAHSVDAGDILVTKMGDPPGDACRYPPGQPKAIITADCIKLRIHPLLTYSDFFVSALNSQLVRSQILTITKGVAQQKVSLGRFSTVAIPLPPIDEQSQIIVEISERFSQAEHSHALIQTSLNRAARLRQSVLKQAFEGQLVPQDPNDEPASVLLERLRSAAASANSKAGTHQNGAPKRRIAKLTAK